MDSKQLTSFSQILDQKLTKLKTDLEESLVRKIDEKLNEKLAFLPSKDEFYSKMDEVIGELQTIRDEITVLSHHSSQHADDIIKLKSKLALT